MKTIYKKDSKGKLRYLTITTLLDKITQESGVVGGASIINISTCIGKNIGKTNATTPKEQAVIEAQAKIKKKLEEGYYLTTAEAMVEKLILPMLAKDFKEESKKVIYPCFVQRKYDGMRCLAIIKSGVVTLMSRTGKIIDTCLHINTALGNRKLEDIILDGELYNSELGSFQDQMRAIKKYRKGITEQINFNVYDCLSSGEFSERYKIIKNILRNPNTSV